VPDFFLRPSPASNPRGTNGSGIAAHSNISAGCLTLRASDAYSGAFFRRLIVRQLYGFFRKFSVSGSARLTPALASIRKGEISMSKVKRSAILAVFGLAFLIVNSASAASSKIGILVFDGFLTSDVTAPIEVFGAATKKAWFSSYEVVVISATKNKLLSLLCV